MTKLFSIKHKYSKRIFSKEKLVEFRRQNVKVTRKEICLIYTSCPIKKLEGYFIVEEKIRLPIKELWDKTKEIAGISLEEFMNYFEGCDSGTAIIFRKVIRLRKEWSLDELRNIIGESFRPPQSYCNLENSFLGLLNITIQ